MYLLIALCLGASAFLLGRSRAGATERRLRAEAEAQAAAQRRAAKEEAEAQLAEGRRAAAELAERRRQALAAEVAERKEQMRRARERLDRRQQSLERGEELRRARGELLTGREQALEKLVQRRKEAEAAQKSAEAQARSALPRIAEESREEVKARLAADWIEEARAEAADEVRQVEQHAADPEHNREAKRLIDVAIQRYHGHYLTERLLSNIPLPEGVARRTFGPELSYLQIIGEVAHVNLALADDELSLRLEGQDSFGREIARRAISRFSRNLPRGGEAAVRQAVQAIADELDRETMDLGKRAFKELEIPRAHPEIVKLVGRLNYRTSYTQNQWKHAIEAAFLCGMMAAELRLDVKIARRAALMHDIGKALTHEIDGSHAVIGADYARRLGETEMVANAIGAHHTDEPFNSAYAYIVAAADALSGARPGARHEPADNYVQRIDDLHRITSGFPGVERAYAVQAGREVRIYVKEDQISDLRAVEMSSEIAEEISNNLVFPGQIKVTVIREVCATAVAS